jgi:hypothetical protein
MTSFQKLRQSHVSQLIILMGCLIALGCDDDGDESSGPVVRVGGETAGETAGTEAGTEAGVEAGTEAGVEAGTEAGMMGGGEPPRVRTIETCEELCGVYDSCDSSDAHPWGECLSGCMDEDWEEQRFRSYVSCLKLEPCETISACRIPPLPLPSCDDACAQLNICEVDYRFPGALIQNTECSTACADETWARQISSCVQANERRLCDDAGFFDRCILEARGGECYTICQAQADCDETLDLIDCTVTCLTEAPSDDPLAAYRQEQSQACVVSATDCNAISTCLEPAIEPIGETVSQVCAAAEICDVFAEGVCPEVADRALRELSPEGIECLLETFESDCSADLTTCFTSTTTASDNACADYCFIGALCDTLPMDQSEFDCVEECQALAASNDPTAFTPYQAQIACVDVGSCQAFNDCISGTGTGDACSDLCTQRSFCEIEDEEDCMNRCSNRFSTERSRRERTCGALLSCESSDLCQIPEAPNCEDYCQPLDTCGLADPDCLTQCDNAELYNPDEHLPLLTCVNASERCDFVSACQEDQSNAQACLTYCAYLDGCSANSDDLGEPTETCALACARGELNETQALEFIPAYGCISDLDSTQASCSDVSQCIDNSSSSCQALCTLANRCGLPFTEEFDTDCITACEGGDLPIADQLCAISADQREAGCGDVATCLGFPIPQPTPACETYCDALKTCDPSIDLYTCHSQCIEDDSGDALRAACVEIVSCEEMIRCQDEEAVSPMACLQACQDLDINCDVTGDGELFSTLTACEDQCGGVVLALGEEATPDVEECITGADCDDDALNACFSGNLGGEAQEICERSWTALEQCGLLTFLMVEETQFYVDCAAQYAADAAGTIAQVECLEMTYLTDPTCFSAILNCGFF